MPRRPVRAKGSTKPSTRPPTRPPGRKGRDGEGKPLVLVVEDYEDARELYAEYLAFAGFRVEQASDGAEALDKAARFVPDLILMDLSMPGMDGWEATRRLKRDTKTMHIPIIALTGHVLAGHAESAKSAGCDSFLAKPCLPDAMVAEVRRMLEK
jgi:two-component system cell cycle response regulator DivK